MPDGGRFLSGLFSKVRPTASLVPTPPTAPLEPAPKPPEQAQKEADERRLLITAYQKNPRLLPEFQDKPFIYRVVSDERAFQKERLDALRLELRQIVMDPLRHDPEDPEVQRRRSELEARIEECNGHLTGLFLLLKRITGITKKTGGTDFLATDPPAGP